MHHFAYIDQNLHCESVDLAAVASLYGTPTYVYSAATIESNYRRLLAWFPGLDVQICYAMKANSNLAILRHLHNLGAGYDLVSGGEIRRVVAAGGIYNAAFLPAWANRRMKSDWLWKMVFSRFTLKASPSWSASTM